MHTFLSSCSCSELRIFAGPKATPRRRIPKLNGVSGRGIGTSLADKPRHSFSSFFPQQIFVPGDKSHSRASGWFKEPTSREIWLKQGDARPQSAKAGHHFSLVFLVLEA